MPSVSSFLLAIAAAAFRAALRLTGIGLLLRLIRPRSVPPG